MKKIKNLLVLALLVLALPVVVSAELGADHDVSVSCGWLGCNQGQVNTGFSEVSSALNTHAGVINTNWAYVLENEAKWGIDRAGVSMSSVERFLKGSYWDLISENFVLKSEVARLEDRLDRLEAMLVLGSGYTYEDLVLMTARIKAGRTGETQFVSGFTCSSAVCFKFN